MFGFCEKDEKSADQSSKMFLRVPRANRFEVAHRNRAAKIAQEYRMVRYNHTLIIHSSLLSIPRLHRIVG